MALTDLPIPKHVIEAERKIIHLMLHHLAATTEVRDAGITEELFTPSHRLLIRTIFAYHRKGHKVDRDGFRVAAFDAVGQENIYGELTIYDQCCLGFHVMPDNLPVLLRQLLESHVTTASLDALHRYNHDRKTDVIGAARRLAEDVAKATSVGRQNQVAFRMANRIEPEKWRWLWQNRFPLGALSLLAGDPGLGKTLIALDMVAAVTVGRSWCDGGWNEQGSALIMSAEDSASRTIVPRLMAAGADLSKVAIVDGLRTDDPKRHAPINLDQLHSVIPCLQELPDARVILIDPISAFMDGIDTHKNSEVRGMLSHLTQLADERQISVIGISHLNKGQTKGLYKVTGSHAFVAAPRAVYQVAEDPQSPGTKAMFPTKANLAGNVGAVAYQIETNKDCVPVVKWSSEILHNVTLDDWLAPAKSTTQNDAAAWLQSALQAGTRSVDDLQKQSGFSWSTLNRAKKQLNIHSKKGEFAGGWSWCLGT